MSASFLPTFSLCICTRNRPDDLRRALQSVQASTTPVHQLIVSDDSTDYRTRDMMLGEFPAITYLEGPRRGLCANRNRALAAATGTHVLFIDDDATLGQTFLQQMAERLLDDQVHHVAAGGPANRLILTGTEVCHGERVRPHKGAFLGFQQHNYRCGERMYSIVINSTVFPRELFDHVAFDEQLVYGYDEIDLASRAVFKHGFRIEWLASAANHHFPSPANRDYYRPFLHASRIYTTFKRYGWSERRPAKAAVFLMVAVSHNLAHNVRRQGLRGVAEAWRTTWLACGYIHRHARGAGTTGGVTPIAAESATVTPR
ncbi:glycosyltransferase family 2 protein [Cupriavidus sp. 2KB_3]|uniref:glycosyltransferase family 2 protein n=1 Tax=Cupriavidus TaxID=106589 RepID=UPI0011ED3E0D|nr:glycosyltransferase family 2 protein [Cupriavidus campinensis]